jgi:hypothetical protein
MGGKIEVIAVDSNGSVTIKFDGPARLRQGVELVLKDLKAITAVNIVNF